HEALTRAADPKAFPEQLETLGLEPWQAGKFYSSWHSAEAAQVVVDTSEVGRRLGEAPRDIAAAAAELLSDLPSSAAPLPPVRFYRLLQSTMEGAAKQRHLMDGVALAPGGTSRRELAPLPEPTPELAKASRARRNLQVLAETPLGDKTDSEKLLAQL